MFQPQELKQSYLNCRIHFSEMVLLSFSKCIMKVSEWLIYCKQSWICILGKSGCVYSSKPLYSQLFFRPGPSVISSYVYFHIPI